MNESINQQESAWSTADRILDKALEIAEKDSWEHLHLYSISDSLGITLDDIRRYYPQKDDLVEAWFDRADSAVLRHFPDAELNQAKPVDRLQQVMMCWFDALSPHRQITRQMLAYKLEPGHLHLQIPGIMRVSRTVQWFREAAQLDTTGICRVFQETALSLVYLTTFSFWFFDDSPQSEKTRRLLQGRLRKIPGFTSIRGFPGA